MLVVINQNLFGVTDTNVEIRNPEFNQKKTFKRKNYVCPNPDLQLKNNKKVNEDGTYAAYPPYTLFKLNSDKSTNGFEGNLRVRRPETSSAHPNGTIDSKIPYDDTVVLLAYPYNGIIKPVRSNQWCKFMSGTSLRTPHKNITASNMPGSYRNILYLALDVDADKIKNAIKKSNKQPDNKADLVTGHTNYEPTPKVTTEYCDLLVFTTDHIVDVTTNKDEPKHILRKETRRLRAYLNGDTLVFKISSMEVNNETVTGEVQFDKVGTSTKIWERYSYTEEELKSFNSRRKKRGNKRPHNTTKITDKSGNKKKQQYADKKQNKPFQKGDKKPTGKNKDQKSFGNKDFSNRIQFPDGYKAPGAKPDKKQDKPQQKPYNKKNDDSFKKYDKPAGKKEENKNVNGKKKQKKPQYNKHGILIQ